MKNTTVILIFLFIANLLTAAVSLEIQNVDTDAGTLDIYMTNDEEVGGFQFELIGITITGASGGTASEYFAFVTSTSSTILGFDISGGTIPPGSGTLTQVTFTAFEGQDICFGTDPMSNVISDAIGGSVSTEWGECYSAGGCASGIYDCNGVCDGDAVEDECGVCEGLGAIYGCGCNDIPEGECDCEGNVLDCNEVCGGEAEIDMCGVCNGDGSTCDLGCDDDPVCLSIANVNTDAGTLDIYMTNQAGCSYCTDPIYDNQYDCEAYGDDGTDDASWVFDPIMDDIVCADTNGIWFNGEVGGFQFELPIVTITGASGGTASEYFAIVNTTSTIILGFDLGGGTIPPGSEILTQATFTDFVGESVCFGTDPTANAISDAIGGSVSTAII